MKSFIIFYLHNHLCNHTKVFIYFSIVKLRIVNERHKCHKVLLTVHKIHKKKNFETEAQEYNQLKRFIVQ